MTPVAASKDHFPFCPLTLYTPGVTLNVQISPLLPLPDRLACMLTPHLQGSFVNQLPPPPPTASSAAVLAQPSIDLNRHRINRNTRLKKKDLLWAIHVAGSITEPNADDGQVKETTLGTRCTPQQRGPLTRLAAVVEVSPRPSCFGVCPLTR